MFLECFKRILRASRREPAAWFLVWRDTYLVESDHGDKGKDQHFLGAFFNLAFVHDLRSC